MMRQSDGSSELVALLQNIQYSRNDLRTAGNTILRQLRRPELGHPERETLFGLLARVDDALEYLADPSINGRQAILVLDLLQEIRQSHADLLAAYPAFLPAESWPGQQKTEITLGALRDCCVADFKSFSQEAPHYLSLNIPEVTKNQIRQLLDRVSMAQQALLAGKMSEEKARQIKYLWSTVVRENITDFFRAKRKETETHEQLTWRLMSESKEPSDVFSIAMDEKAEVPLVHLPTIPDPLQWLVLPDEEEKRLVNDDYRCLISTEILFRPVTTGVNGDRFYEDFCIREWVKQKHCNSPFIPNQAISNLAFNQAIAGEIRLLMQRHPGLVAEQYCPVEQMQAAIDQKQIALIESLLFYDVQFRLLADTDVMQAVNESKNRKIHALFSQHLDAHKKQQRIVMTRCIFKGDYATIEKLLNGDTVNIQAFLQLDVVQKATDPKIKVLFQKARQAQGGPVEEPAMLLSGETVIDTGERKSDLLEQAAEQRRVKIDPKKFTGPIQDVVLHFGGTKLGVMGSACDEAECFYDAIAQGLENAGIPIPLVGEEPGYKKLRKLCYQFVLQQAAFCKGKLGREGVDYQHYVDAIKSIDVESKTIALKEEQQPCSWIKGRPAIEGVFICKLFNIQLHVVELKTVQGEIIVNASRHHLIDAYSSRIIDIAEFYPSIHANPRIVHVLHDVSRGHVVPFLPYLEKLNGKNGLLDTGRKRKDGGTRDETEAKRSKVSLTSQETALISGSSSNQHGMRPVTISQFGNSTTMFQFYQSMLELCGNQSKSHGQQKGPGQ